MKNTLTFLLPLFALSCGQASDTISGKPAPPNTPQQEVPEPEAPKPGAPDAEPTGQAPVPGSPESADAIGRTCNTDKDCSVIPSYCGGFTSVQTTSIAAARKHYDGIGQIKSCREGTVSPRPKAYCEQKLCEPTAWNEGYAIHFAESVDFRAKTSFEGESLSPIPLTRKDKSEALVALRTKLEKDYPDIFAKSTNYHGQYMGAKGENHKNPILLGNFFCRSMGVDWRHNWVAVDDGGSCFFQFRYDLVTKKLIQFNVNGRG